MNLDKITQIYLELFPGDFSGNPAQRQTPNFFFAVTDIYGFKKAQLLHFNENLSEEIGFGKIENQTKTLLMKAVTLPPDTDSAFHIYACLWTPDKVVFYTDGVPVRSIRMNQWMRQFYREPMYIIVNNAVDHRYLQHIDNRRLPVALEVDWIRVYAPPQP